MLRASTDYIVIHCTATRARDMDSVTVADVDRWHKARGWAGCGYHFVIEADGNISPGRDINERGAHVRGFNSRSIGIALVGGLDDDGKPCANFRPAQMVALSNQLEYLRGIYPFGEVLGHRDLSPDLDGDGVIERHEWLKECPCFDVRIWLESGQ